MRVGKESQPGIILVIPKGLNVNNPGCNPGEDGNGGWQPQRG